MVGGVVKPVFNFSFVLLLARGRCFGRVAATAWGRLRKPDLHELLCQTTSPRRRKRSKRPRQTKMILTNCAACAAPLAHDHKKRCIRCKTRYCNEACQRQHWERGGHEALCRRIKRGGGAEQYHAEKKYKEAVAVAVEACAEDTTGQTC